MHPGAIAAACPSAVSRWNTDRCIQCCQNLAPLHPLQPSQAFVGTNCPQEGKKTMRRFRRRNVAKGISRVRDRGVPCLPNAVMHSRAVRMALIQGFAATRWPVPATFIRLIAVLLFGIVNARAVAADSPSHNESGFSALGHPALVPGSRAPAHGLSRVSSAPGWSETRSRDRSRLSI